MNPPSLDPHGSDWSKLPSDLLHSIFERLGFADFQRAKCVCSPWKSTSRQLAPNNQIPWLIQFPEKGEDYCLLLNPEEKNKMYKIRDLGVNFASSHCLATYGSWLLMQDHLSNLYIFNMFTRESINLPPVESQHGLLKIERTIDGMFFVKLSDDVDFLPRGEHIKIFHPLLWMDEKTKDYVVMWKADFAEFVLIHCRKGDNFWRQTKIPSCEDMVYKDHKLYLYAYNYDNVEIFDFSGESPREICNKFVSPRETLMALALVRMLRIMRNIEKDHLVVTMTGEILKVKSNVRKDSDVWSFRIYKMDSSKNQWEKLTCLGDEAIILDLGITVPANNIEGVKRNSIYFSGHPPGLRFGEPDRVWSEKDLFNFDLDTHMVERPHRSICSSIQSSKARWFVPNTKRK